MEPRDGDGLPLPGIAIILVVLGVLLLQEPVLKGSRPTTPSVGQHHVADAERVPARLWQDPVGAVLKYQSSGPRQTGGMGASAGVEGRAGAEVRTHELGTLGKEIAEAIGQSKSDLLTVFGVFIVGGPYVEDQESRLRTRYAVLSALSVLGYAPVRSTHIGYVVFPGRQASSTPLQRAWLNPPVPSSPPWTPHPSSAVTTGAASEPESAQPAFVLPYEWLRHAETGQRILLLWIQEESLEPRPLTSLATLVSRLRDAAEDHAGGEHVSVPLSKRMEFKLLGPAGSGTLVQMLEEADRESDDGTQTGALPELQEVEILSPTATASEFLLKTATGHSTEDLRQAIWRKPGKGFFLRSTPTDLQLAELMIGELGRRNVAVECKPLRKAVLDGQSVDSDELCAGHKDHIVLISEWDTFYGRAMPAAFENALRLRHNCSDLKHGLHLPWVHRLSYLRGIDGQLSGEPPVEKRTTEKEKTSKRTIGPIERPIGYGQVDYLRRVAGTIKDLEAKLHREHGGRLAAIGVLGSDVYDKLLILQALRPEFSNTLFFSTDLDARLLHPEELPWTRNLLVASGFGLELAPELQRGVLPFRGSYQTSRFFSTLLAFQESGWPVDSTLDRCLRPRLFEIGRDRPYDITPSSQLESCEICLSEDNCNAELHSPSRPPPRSWRSLALGVAVLALAALLLYHYVYRIRENGRFYWQQPGRTRMIMILGVQGAYLVAIGGILLVGIMFHQVRGEPFTFSGGVSIWPTEVLRLFAGFLAVRFSIEAWRIIRQSDEEIEKAFFLGGRPTLRRPKRNPGEKDLSSWAPLKRVWRRYRRYGIYHWRQLREALTTRAEKPDLQAVDVQVFWNAYREMGDFKRRSLRLLPWAAVLFILNSFMIKLFGDPFVPARGGWSYSLDFAIIVLLAVIPFIVLLLGVFDATRLCTEMSEWFVDARMQWPRKAREVWKERLGLDADDLREWLGIEFIARRTEAVGGLIYFPFVVIFVLSIARSSYFDRWDMPTGLAIVILASALYAVVAALSLRRSAEHARGEALQAIEERLIKAVGEQSENRVKQLELLKERIAQNRRGAFRPWRQQPVMKALLWFVGGASLASIEFLDFWR